MKDTPKKANLKGSGAVPRKDHTYQPSKAEKEEEVDMPGWTLDQVSKALMSPPWPSTLVTQGHKSLSMGGQNRRTTHQRSVQTLQCLIGQ